MTRHAIVLAGGSGRRLGGVDKPGLVVGGRSLLDVALAAVEHCTDVVVVGPRRAGLPPAVRQASEEPAGTGPVAALAAGLAALPGRARQVLVLAADLPFITSAATAELCTRLDDADTDAAFAVDSGGRLQYLLAAWRGPALAARLTELTPRTNRRMRDLVPAHHVRVALAGVQDCDTPEDLRAARRQLARPPGSADQAR
ncbi:molybdenum cofactor guanylyltransferase [Skermania piniformis]|uniref:molybdenum cofactor guanylyltransferase n=1 Tax=Skermania pinensis TaxID=39122 RepID=UPI001FE9D836|nr:NTP transferase domain-containing protein [Skermania piniformis]